MDKILQLIKKYLWLALSCSLLVFIWGLSTWIIAHYYQPELSVSQPARQNLKVNQTVNSSLAKYQSLLDGSLFFVGKTMTGGFHSQLILWGLINGGYAIVGVDPESNQNTWIVKAGDTVGGEQILSVGNGYITVRNHSGAGKVALNE